MVGALMGRSVVGELVVAALGLGCAKVITHRESSAAVEGLVDGAAGDGVRESVRHDAGRPSGAGHLCHRGVNGVTGRGCSGGCGPCRRSLLGCQFKRCCTGDCLANHFYSRCTGPGFTLQVTLVVMLLRLEQLVTLLPDWRKATICLSDSTRNWRRILGGPFNPLNTNFSPDTQGSAASSMKSQFFPLATARPDIWDFPLFAGRCLRLASLTVLPGWEFRPSCLSGLTASPVWMEERARPRQRRVSMSCMVLMFVSYYCGN